MQRMNQSGLPRLQDILPLPHPNFHTLTGIALDLPSVVPTWSASGGHALRNFKCVCQGIDTEDDYYDPLPPPVGISNLPIGWLDLSRLECLEVTNVTEVLHVPDLLSSTFFGPSPSGTRDSTGSSQIVCC